MRLLLPEFRSTLVICLFALLTLPACGPRGQDGSLDTGVPDAAADAGTEGDAGPVADTGDVGVDSKPEMGTTDLGPDLKIDDPTDHELECDPTVSIGTSSDRTYPELGWRWYYGQSVNQVKDRIDAGYRIVDLEIEEVDPLEFSVAMVENTGRKQKGWWWYYHQTRDELEQRINDHDARVIDLEVLELGGSKLFSAVMIHNTGNDQISDWRYIADDTPQNILDTALNNDLRVIDLDPWVDAGGAITYSAVMVDNTGSNNRAWWMYHGQTEESLNEKLGDNNAYIQDVDRAPDGDFTVVMDRPSGDLRPRWWWYGYDVERVRELFRRLGSRIIDVQRLDDTSDPEFLVVMEGWTHPRTGVPVGSLSPFDRQIQELMWVWESPGASVAVMRGEKLVYARSYGFADISSDTVVFPKDRFRIASLTKPITKSAIFRLADEGELELDDSVFTEHLSHLTPSDGIDARINLITIQDLLGHRGGWDWRNKVDGTIKNDPMLTRSIRKDLDLDSPASCEDRIRWVLDNKQLDYSPGSTYAYSNFGYCILGKVIEEVTGESYEAWVQENILRPAGATRMQLANTKRSEQADDQVVYYDRLFDPKVKSVFPSVSDKVAAPYGKYYLEAMDAHGGWIATPADYVRYAANTDYSPFPNRTNWPFNGSLPGSQTAVKSRRDGELVAAVFLNTRLSPNASPPLTLQQALGNALNDVGSWPCHDLDDQIP